MSPVKADSIDYILRYNNKFKNEINNWTQIKGDYVHVFQKIKQPLNKRDVCSITNIKFLFKGSRQLKQPINK